MTVLLQISDTHFGTEQPPVVRALAELAEALTPDVIVVSGDITQRARRSQFDAARRFIDSLAPKALLAIPGNHDIPLFNLAARLFAPYAGFRRAFGPALEGEVDADGLLVIGLNTTRARRHKHGELSAQQIERTAARLRQATPGQLRVVVVHQPVWALRPSDRANLLRGHREAVAAWTAAGVDLILGGHIHLPYLHALPPTGGRQAWAVQAGTALSSRIRDGVPNSVNVIRCAGSTPSGSEPPPRRCVVERWDHQPGEGRFARIAETTLQLESP